MLSNLALEASAGSGKTFALSVRYISLLFLGSKPSEILTLTFTNKAANEMKKRIFETIKNLENSDELGPICQLCEKSPDEILALQPKILKSFLSSDLKISTIDSFFSSILRKFAFNIGVSPDFSLEDSIINDEKIESFIRICKHELLYPQLTLFALSEKKRLLEIFTLFTTLYEKNSEINIENFAKKSAPYPDENRVLEVLETIKERFEANGLSQKALNTLEAHSLKELLDKKFLTRDDFNYWSYKKYTNDEINNLHAKLKKMIYKYIKAKEIYLFSQIARLYKAFLEALNKVSKKSSSLSFSEMTNRLYNLLEDEIKKDFLYFRIDGSFSHLLIDEFQDTNIVQYKILEPFMREIVSGIGVKENRTLFIVGDTKQSIYRFRGGVKELFSYAVNSLNLKVDVLGTNYRSSLNVVKFINKTYGQKISGYKNQSTKNDAKNGFVGVYIDDDLENNIIKQIEKLLALGVSSSDIALLCHTNKEALLLKELIEEKISGVKVTMEAKRKLIDIPIISAIIDFIHYLYFGEQFYLENFEFISGKKYLPEDHNFDLNGNVENLVAEIIRYFNIFVLEDDQLQFIQSCAGYIDIEDFLFNYKDLSQSSVSKDEEGIKVLTVHKSKGLEFSNVLVIDRFQRPRSGGGIFLYDYDGVRLENMFLRVKNRELLDEPYRLAKDKEGLKEEEEKLNAQYVAMSRAKDNLFIFAKSKSSSFANLTLDAQEVGEIVINKKQAIKNEVTKQQQITKRYGSQEIEKTEKKESASSDFGSIDFGLALHYMLEMLGEFDIKAVLGASQSMQNRFGTALCEEHLKDIKKRVVKLLQNSEFQALIKGAKLLKEQPLYHNGQRKQVDLLALRDDKVVVIDYKSSQELQSSHVKQVSVYKNALEKIYGKECEGYLCYLKKDDIKIVKV